MALPTPRFRLLDSRTQRIYLCWKPSGLWYFVMAALGNDTPNSVLDNPPELVNEQGGKLVDIPSELLSGAPGKEHVLQKNAFVVFQLKMLLIYGLWGSL